MFTSYLHDEGLISRIHEPLGKKKIFTIKKTISEVNKQAKDLNKEFSNEGIKMAINILKKMTSTIRER